MAVGVAVIGLGFMGVTHYRSYKNTCTHAQTL
jgi:hypothetical protein